MNDSNKLWVIDLGDEVTIQEPREKRLETPRKVAAPSPMAKPSPRKAEPQPRSAGSGQLQFAMMLALSYLLGPFSLLLWSRGRRHRLRTAVAIVSGLGCLAVAWQWQNILSLDNNGAQLLLVLAVAGVLAITAFSSWAMALNLAFASRTRPHTALPAWMRTGWGITSLGLIAPGLGLFLNGHRKRAVAVLWSLWPVFPAAVILAHGTWTWRWLQNASHTNGQQRYTEYLIAGSVAILVLGYLFWLAQALSGLYLKSRRSGTGRARHGDRYALALLAAVITLAVLFPPAEMADFLHDNGLYLDQHGYEVLPLELTRVAHRLAPGQATYSQTLARLEGQPAAEDPVPADPRDPGQTESVFYGMMAPQADSDEAQTESPLQESAGRSQAGAMDSRLHLHDEPEPR